MQLAPRGNVQRCGGRIERVASIGRSIHFAVRILCTHMAASVCRRECRVVSTGRWVCLSYFCVDNPHHPRTFRVRANLCHMCVVIGRFGWGCRTRFGCGWRAFVVPVFAHSVQPALSPPPPPPSLGAERLQSHGEMGQHACSAMRNDRLAFREQKNMYIMAWEK